MEEKSKHKGALLILQTNRNRSGRSTSWASCCCSERKEQYVSSQLWSVFCCKLLDTRWVFFPFMCNSLGWKPALWWRKQRCVETLQCSNRCQSSKAQNLHYHIITATHSVFTENCMRRIQRRAVMHCYTDNSTKDLQQGQYSLANIAVGKFQIEIEQLGCDSNTRQRCRWGRWAPGRKPMMLLIT